MGHVLVYEVMLWWCFFLGSVMSLLVFMRMLKRKDKLFGNIFLLCSCVQVVLCSGCAVSNMVFCCICEIVRFERFTVS